MRRHLNRREITVLWLAVIMLFAAPAVAHHANVPATPVTGIDLRLSEYATGTFYECGDVVDANQLRIEVFATVADRPSEHWTTRLTVDSTVRGSSWYALWHHQNVGPHVRSLTSEILQSQQALVPGRWTVTVEVTGDESGVELVESCTITRR